MQNILKVARDAVPFAVNAYDSGSLTSDLAEVSSPFRDGEAHGYLTFNEGALRVGIAGTDSIDSLLNDAVVSPRSLLDWSRFTGIPLAKDSLEVASSKGFLDHLYKTYSALEYELDRLGIKDEDIHVAKFRGHSLGGAMGLLLPHTDKFKYAETVTFGAPKVYHHTTGFLPSRVRYQCWQYQDTVPYLPFGYKHAECQDVILTLPNRVPFGETPANLKPFIATVVGGIWISRAWRAAAKACGSKSVQVFRAHSMARYSRLLGV